MLRKTLQQSFRCTVSVTKEYLPGAIFLLTLYFVNRLNQVTPHALFADPTEMANQPPYIGLFSRLGVLMWSMASAICLFSAVIARHKAFINRQYSLFLGCSGLLLGVLLLDDFFEIHEYVAIALSGAKDMFDETVRAARDRYEGLVILSYAIAFFIYLLRFWKFLLRGRIAILAVAIGCHMTSVVMDLGHFRFPGSILLEDGSKFLGIFGMLLYFTQYCRTTIEKMLSDG